MKLKILLFFGITFFLNFAWAQNYKIDSGHSNVQIQVERFGVVDVVGRFKDVQGTITYNEEDLNKTMAESTINVDSYDANNSGGEEAVKGAVFLDAANHATITFKSKNVVIKDDRKILIGDLTIRGNTKEIELPFTIKGPLMDLPTQKQSIAFSANITINRQDYGIEFNRALPNGIKLVADEIDISLKILAIAE